MVHPGSMPRKDPRLVTLISYITNLSIKGFLSFIPTSKKVIIGHNACIPGDKRLHVVDLIEMRDIENLNSGDNVRRNICNNNTARSSNV